MTANRITDITRDDIIDFLLIDHHNPFNGSLELLDFLSRVWPLLEMPSTDERFSNAHGDIWQHVVNNSDWTYDYLLKTYLELSTCSDELFLKFLSECVHPRVIRDRDRNSRYVEKFNSYLRVDGFQLVQTDEISGWPLYRGVELALKEIHNQGRVRSDNVAGLEHDGLRFRSPQEINLYKAFKGLAVTFAPLPVFLRGGPDYRRLEPDFILLQDGILLVVELDGETTHQETPVQADKRLGMFKHEGAYIERVETSECATESQAVNCAKRLLQLIQKYRTNK